MSRLSALQMKHHWLRLTVASVAAALAATAGLAVPAHEDGVAAGATEPTPQIAFVRSELESPYASHLFVMNPNGSELRQLTSGSGRDGDQVWSPDGRSLVFVRWTFDHTAPGQVDIWDSDVFVIGADGTGLRQLTDDGSSFSATWSPDGRTIAYGDGTRILLMNADGTGKRELTSVSSDDLWVAPSWSPDGKRIALTTGGGGGFIVNADGTGMRHFTHGSGSCWSPDSRRIAFGGGPPGHRYSSIYVVDALRPGARPRRVTRNAYNESSFAWSPDGRRIVYARKHQGGIYSINVNGTHDRRLTRDPLRPDGLAGGFSWSPDGHELAYASDRSGNGDIYVDAFGWGGKQQLTEGLEVDGAPRWSLSKTPSC